MQIRYLFCLFMLLAAAANAQTIYFHQDFSATTGLVNPQPDTGQFSHVILTAPALSYHKFHKGYMELVRSRQDSASGGIIRALRATPFSPGPETLVIRMTLSVEGVQTPALNALYFYVGEEFNPVNNSFPGNGLMFAKCSMNFTENGFTMKDLETQQVSTVQPLKEWVMVTWVLNNSREPLPYRLDAAGHEETALPGTYDLWVGTVPVSRGSKAYPGASAYSPTKLSNFEIRFRNGIGKVKMDEICIADGLAKPLMNNAFVAPNPARRDVITVSGPGVSGAVARLVDRNGTVIPVSIAPGPQDQLRLKPLSPPAAGIHILQLEQPNGTHQALKVMIE